MRETRTYGSEGGEAQTNGPSLPLYVARPSRACGTPKTLVHSGVARS
ncbi:MAG: hypothetical protein KatS3mg109_1507 [Pirellulaceae bacterium]|nr:MAG: hypothetical protein KatS3mg109_1507 [Pirellulaceae bacterium]